MINNKLQFVIPGELRIGGYAGKMTDYVINNQLLDRETWALLVDQFRRREDGINGGWRGEYWGKMMRGASLTYRLTKNEKLYSVLVETVEDMLTVQDELGRFSTYTVDTEFHSWDMWARKYVMLGMMYFLDICKNKTLKRRIIKALKKHADYILKHIGDGKGKISIIDTSAHIGSMNSCSILEPFVKLYDLTGEERYFDFATYLVNTGLCKGTNLVELALKKELYPYQYPETKAYEMMSCFEGVLEYYKHTGNTDHLVAVENFVDMLIKSDYTLIGGAGCKHEFFDNSTLTQTEPATMDVMQETCVTVTFIKLCAKLLSLTGDSKYAEYIECSALNAMYGAVNNENQKMSRALLRTWLKGGEVFIIKEHEAFPFDSYSPLYMDRRGLRCGGVQLLGENRCYGCCVCIGSAGTAISGLFAVMKGESGVFVNLYNDCHFKTALDNERITVNVKANPYESKGAKIRVDGKGKHFTLALRVPSWAEDFSVLIDSENAQGTLLNGYILIDKVWNCEEVDIKFKAPVKMRVINGKIAFTRGPVVLARDARFGDISPALKINARDGKSIRARRVKNALFNSNISYEIQTSGGAITLCDYAQAGKNYDDEKSLVTVWQDNN